MTAPVSTRTRKSPPSSTVPPTRKPRKPPTTAVLPPAEAEVERPTEHNGIPVLREELIQSLPKAPFRISRVFLADDSVAFACRDCAYTGDTRGEVMVHRNDVHGAHYGQGRTKAANALRTTAVTPDPVLLPRDDGTPAPTNPLEMTLGEFLSLAPSLAALGDLVDRMEQERDIALEELAARRELDKLNAPKIAHWDANRDELVNLRTWKRKIIKRFTDMGFTLNEEGE